MKDNNKIILFAVFAMTALSMRAPMSCVGPLSPLISAELDLSAAAAGFLTTIPLIFFAICAPFAGRIIIKMNSRVLLCACLLMNIAGLLLRSYCGIFGLFAGTALLGCGIGTLNVMMPAFARKQFAGRVSFMMAVYSTAMTAASAISAGICRNVANAVGLRSSLASSVLLAIAAMVLLIIGRGSVTDHIMEREPERGATEQSSEPQGERRARIKLWRYIPLALYMGLQSFLFFSIIAWFPSIVGAVNPQIKNVGMMTMLLQGVSLVPSFAVPIMCAKLDGRGKKKWFGFLITVLYIAGFGVICAAGAKVSAVIVGTTILGLATGATMSYALALLAEKGKDPAETAIIAGFCQCVGYVIASFGPTGLGVVYDMTGSWQSVLAIFIVLSGVLAGLALIE